MSSNESFPSVSQIVEQIIESLSESISQLMMMVIILQERNADPPPALPNGVGIVTGSANTLYQTAMALASEDYKEYPDIKNEIEVAAQSVNTSSQELNTSLQSLMSTGDKRSGWDGLVKSCKNMSAKTIRLLQIVYGAERERVFRAAQKALDALRNIDPNKASSDGKSFAQQVGEAATKANQLAEYMRGKAEDATPQKRRELLGLADELNAGAKHLIDDANQLLRDPNNPQLKKQVAEDLKDVKNTIDRSVNALKDMDHEFDDAANDFEARSAAMRDSLRDLEAGGLDSYDADILLTAKKERQEMDNLLDDIDGNNPERAKKDLENAKLLNDKLAQLAGMEANNVSDHAKKSELQNIKPVLGQLFNTYENAARNAIMHPHDQSYLDGLDAAHDALDAAIQKLCDLLSNPNAEIDASARKEIDDLDNVRAAVIEGNQPDVTRNAKAAIKENKTLAGLCAAQAGKATDPLRKRTILDAVDELQRLLPHQLLAAKQALESPTPDNIKHMNDKTDTMQDQIRATALLAQDYPELELLDAAKREKELISKVQGAGTNGDGRGVATFAPQLIDNTKNLGNIAREIAKKKPRGQQARILDSVNKLERLAGPACNDAKALAQNPQNAAAKQGLDKKMEDMRALVDKLVTDTDAELFNECLKQLANLHHMKNSADEGDLGGLADAATSTANTHNRLAPLANAAARRCEDPQRRKQIEEDINELTKALPKGIGQTNEFLLEPTDAKRKPLKNTVTLMEGLVKGLSDPQKYDPSLVRGGQGGGDLARQLADLVALAERLNRNPNDSEARRRLLDLLANLPLDALDTDAERLANLIREQVEALDRLTNAAEAGNKAGVEAAGADMNRIQPKIREQASKMLGKILDPEKQQKVVRALDTIDKLIPPTIDSARKVAANPRDQVARKRMHDQADDIRDQLNILADNAISTNEQRLREAAEREKEALERLRKAVKAGDVPGAKEAINDVKKYNAILTEECRDCAQQVRDPALNKRILDNVNELERLMPILAADCVKGASSPSDLQAQKRALDDIQKCEDLINSLLRDTRADAIALAQIEDGALTEMEQHCKSGDPACANDIRKIIETQKNLKVAATEAAKSLPNERAQANIRNALAELDQLLPAHVNHGKNQLQAPSEKNRDALSDSTTCMRAPLAQIIATLRPTPENIADANAKREAALLAALRAAAARGDKQEVERLLPEINNMNNRLVAQARTEADKIAIPEKAKALRDAATELEGLEKLLAGIARDAANNPNDAQAQAKLAAHTKKMENAMQKIVDILKDKQDTPAGKARRLANALIRMLNSDNMDPGKFLAAAKALANYINSLNLDGSDFDLTAELNKLNKLVSSSNKLNRKQAGDSLDGIMRGLQNAKKPAPVAVIPKTVPKTFEEHIQAVADDIDNHVLLSELGPNDPVTILIRAIAAELTKLANSAKAGKRQDMVVAGRTACQKINELHVLLGGEYANRCKDPRTKERLLRAMQAMKTFSTQMKILTAVKAASGKDKDADTEDQLVSVTKSLGNALNESVSSVKVMKGGRLLQ